MAKRNYDNWSKEEFIREIHKLEKRKKYGVVWEDKSEKVAELCKEKLPVFVEDRNKEIETDKDNPVNILIEGDNYHALSVLNYTHKGRIDVIYIDPPYNTGNEGFVYNDKIVDIEDSFRHSKWLSFMEKRLKLAKSLLKRTGVIFISIDDNEQSQLKLVCDEIFGEKNFLASICWQSTDTLRNDAKHFSVNSEFIHCYAKIKDSCIIKGVLKGEKQKGYYKNHDKDPRGPYLLTPLHAKSGTDSSLYEFKFKNGQVWRPPKGTFPRFSKKTLAKLEKEERIWLDLAGKKVPQKKTYLSDVSNRMPLWTFWKYEDFGSTRQSNQELSQILGKGIFQNPKPCKLIKIIIDSVAGKDAVVLDFFAGSGTTGHAALELNKDDNGNRKFILCTNNENNICTDVCYPRVKKVIRGYVGHLDNKKYDGLEGNLKYFNTDFVDAKSTDRNKKKLVDKSTEMLCLKEDCFDEVKKGSYFKIFKNSQNKYLGIIYDDDGIELFKKEAKIMKKKFVVYVFSLDESAREEEFEDMANMVQLKPIPAVILNVYKRIFK